MKKIKIGYQGIEGSNNHDISMLVQEQRFKNDEVELIPLISSLNVTQALLNKEIDYGIVAKRNSIAGEVQETRNALYGYNYNLIEKLQKPIEHLVCKSRNSKNKAVTKVISHKQALLQSKNNLKKLYPNAQIVEVADTALAAKMVSESSDETLACLCNSASANLYNLLVIHQNVSDQDDNYTEFILFNKVRVPKKDFITKCLKLHDSNLLIQSIILIAISICYILVNYFHFDLMEVAFESSGIVAFLIVAIKSDRLKNYIAYRSLKGYWKYHVHSTSNNEKVTPDQIRLCTFNFDGEDIYLKGWKAGRPRKLLFESINVYHSKIATKKGSLIYEYKSSSNTLLSNNIFEGYVFLSFNLDEDNSEIQELEGRYISKYAPDERTLADSGAIKLFKISEKEYLSLLNTPIDTKMIPTQLKKVS